MTSKKISITNPKGIHARPSALLHSTATEFGCAITLEIGQRKADARNIMEIIALGGMCGDNVVITTDGKGEQEALSAIEAVFARNFDDR